MVSRRKRLLRYLQGKDANHMTELKKQLGIRWFSSSFPGQGDATRLRQTLNPSRYNRAVRGAISFSHLSGV